MATSRRNPSHVVSPRSRSAQAFRRARAQGRVGPRAGGRIYAPLRQRGTQAVQDRHVVQERDYVCYDCIVLGDERVERASCGDTWGVQRECDFLIRLASPNWWGG